MQSFSRRDFLETSCLAAGALLLGTRSLPAAIAPGVETVVSPLVTGEESSAQPDLWALEVRFKPVRMIYSEITDPGTGKSAKQLVWYLAYRAVVRPGSRVGDATAELRERPVFVPEFTFVTEDDGKQKTYQDRILPEAQAAINRRERHKYKNSVEIVGPLPEVTPEGAKVLKSLDGVATWTGIDPNTDFFSVYLTGFSNGYKTGKGPDGQEIVLRRTLMQKFWRPSDRFDQTEDEIRLKDEPNWIYR
ncbi:MAG TPA: twin-arginine translocation signal domain-containing protein [Planctomycetaceae bacterium]|jgi:hypothetical protein|nr:twin-arginine translocation signal domain-containing protein [Planctomycetaceae bacterium]